MAPKTRFAGKTNKEGAPEKKKKNESAAEKKKAAVEKKKAAAVKRRREAKRRGSKTRLRRSLHPIQRSGVGLHLHQNNIPIPIIPRHQQRNCFLRMIERPQKAPTQTPSEAENPLQAPITSNNREDPNRESHSPEAAINNEAQRTIGSNNSDSNPPEAAIGSATIDNDAPRTVISSTLKPQGDELDLLYEIMDEGSVEDVELQDDSYKADIAVDG
ncbi:hypothetical protein IGI04_035761 [Brassica rapa subsp. trilocularis]|uniref:Uncharacterized protein n=1 Tax=Brassica rapa subsp. trilocularis TaxID=1813537 RepID=A0ABQ7LGB4_BRACM|nr:hypothetical protein IGI04_035761 [Brassica rapa subsp. trilocularis]